MKKRLLSLALVSMLTVGQFSTFVKAEDDPQDATDIDVAVSNTGSWDTNLCSVFNFPWCPPKTPGGEGENPGSGGETENPGNEDGENPGAGEGENPGAGTGTSENPGGTTDPNESVTDPTDPERPGEYFPVEPEIPEVPDVTPIGNVDDVFPDDQLAQEINELLGRKDGEITKEDLEAITEFKVTDGKIQSLEGLEYLVNLEELDVSGNVIVELDPIKDLTKLTSVDVSDNAVESLTLKDSEVSVFKNLNNIETLSVSNNPIQNFQFTCFHGLEAITSLDLSYLGLKHIPENTFNGFPGLRYLYLDHNKLTSLPKKVFSKNTCLIGVSLTYNKFTEFPLEAVKDTQIKDIDLEGNQIGDFSTVPDDLDSFSAIYQDLTETTIHLYVKEKNAEQNCLIAIAPSIPFWSFVGRDGSSATNLNDFYDGEYFYFDYDSVTTLFHPKAYLETADVSVSAEYTYAVHDHIDMTTFSHKENKYKTVEIGDSFVIEELADILATEGYEYTYTFTPYFEDEADKAATEGIISVDADGTVTGLKEGTAKVRIDVILNGHPEISGSTITEVTVTTEPVQNQPAKPSTPQTGDTTNSTVYMVMLISVLGVAVVLNKKRSMVK